MNNIVQLFLDKISPSIKQFIVDYYRKKYRDVENVKVCFISLDKENLLWEMDRKVGSIPINIGLKKYDLKLRECVKSSLQVQYGFKKVHVILFPFPSCFKNLELINKFRKSWPGQTLFQDKVIYTYSIFK